MKKKLRAIFASAACILLADQASATIYHITYSGTVTYADDQTGEFGSSAALLGMPFMAYVTYDDAKPGATRGGSAWQDLYQGSDAANPLTAEVVLNGVSRTIGSTYGYDSRFDNSLMPGCSINCSVAGFEQSTDDQFVMDGLFTRNIFGVTGATSDGTMSGLSHDALNFSPTANLTAGVVLFQRNEKTHDVLHSALVSAKIDSATVSTASVPEPGSWALMLGGFGLTGGMLRRSRTTKVRFA